jgi:hypothetical protein
MFCFSVSFLAIFFFYLFVPSTFLFPVQPSFFLSLLSFCSIVNFYVFCSTFFISVSSIFFFYHQLLCFCSTFFLNSPFPLERIQNSIFAKDNLLPDLHSVPWNVEKYFEFDTNLKLYFRKISKCITNTILL